MKNQSKLPYDKKSKGLYQLYVSQPRIDLINQKYSPKAKKQTQMKSYKIVRVYQSLADSISDVQKFIKKKEDFKQQIYNTKNLGKLAQIRRSNSQLGNSTQLRKSNSRQFQYNLQKRLKIRLQAQKDKNQKAQQYSERKQYQLNLQRKRDQKIKKQQQNIRKRQWQLIDKQRSRSHYISTSRRKSQASFIKSQKDQSYNMMKKSRISSAKSQRSLAEESFQETQRNHRFLHLKKSIQTKQKKYQHQYKKALLLNKNISRKKQPMPLQRRTFQKEENKYMKSLPKLINIQQKKISTGTLQKRLIDKKLKKLQKIEKDAIKYKTIHSKNNTKQVAKIKKNQKSNNPQQSIKDKMSQKQEDNVEESNKQSIHNQVNQQQSNRSNNNPSISVNN